MNNYAQRVARLKQELIKLKTNQTYGLAQQKIYTFKSQRINSRRQYGSEGVQFSFLFKPIVNVVPITNVFIQAFTQAGDPMSRNELSHLSHSGALQQLNIDENGWYILKNGMYTLSKYVTIDGTAIPQTPFSIQVQVQSIVDGSLVVTEL